MTGPRKRPTRARPRTVADLARACGVDRSTATRWVRRGCPRRADGSFDLAAVERWVAGYRAAANDRSGEPAAPATDLGRTGASTLARRRADTAYRRIRAEFALLRLRKARAAVVEQAEVARLLEERRQHFRPLLRQLSRDLAPQLAGVRDARSAEAIIDREFDELLRELHGGDDPPPPPHPVAGTPSAANTQAEGPGPSAEPTTRKNPR